MRVSRSFLLPVALLVTVLRPTSGIAAEPHSWCVTGQALSPTLGDTATNQIISHVCNQTQFNDCCSSRWGLKCVQAASSYEHSTTGNDICGRYQWAQGPIKNTQQYYPRDFNLFAVAGDATGLADVEGPVGGGNITTASSFSLNGSQQEPVAVVANFELTLNGSGTVYGAVDYATSPLHDSKNVTYADGTRPTSSVPSPINFYTAQVNLTHMSAQMALYNTNGTATTKLNQAITFTGSDQEMNVFTLNSSLLTGTTSFIFNVPQNSAVIINVNGTLFECDY